MNTNEELVQTFYDAFARLDHATMNDCYSSDPVFNDPVFGLLQGDEVKAMWEMLCKSAKDLNLQAGSIVVDGEYVTCNWTARYTFSKTGRKVVNEVKAYIRLQNGKITEHSDDFNLYKWSRQAFGHSGILLGWSGYMKNKIHSQARDKLAKYMEGKLAP